MKKLLSVLLAFILLFTISISAAEDPKAEEELPDGFVEAIAETDRSYTVPVGFGIFYSVIIFRNGVSVVFSPIRNRAALIGIKTIDHLTDVKEIRVHFKNDQTAVLPAVIEMKSYDVGTFFSLNLTVKTVTAAFKLFSMKSAPDKVIFVHSDGTENEMSIGDLDQALSDLFGSTVDVANRAGKAVETFLNNLKNGVRIFVSESSDSVGKALKDAGHWISESVSSAGEKAKELKDKAKESIGNAVESTGEVMQNAAETFKEFWNGLWEKKE